MNYVQSYISNISFPDSLEEVYNYAHFFDMEKIMMAGECGEYEERKTEWTAPKWCKKGDIVFFMHAKTADAKIRKLKNELLRDREHSSDSTFWTIMNALIRAKKIHDTYGGKIFAIGKISGEVIYDNMDSGNLHWKSKIYAPIDDIFLLENLIDISELKSEIEVSRQSSITPVFGEKFDFLKSLILKKNETVEKYFVDSVAEPMPLYRLNDDNWLSIVNCHRRDFFLEAQFGTFYVNRFLKILGDKKTFYEECACQRENKRRTFVDNVIKMNGKYLPVEIKLSVSAEKNIKNQLMSYCNLKQLYLTEDKIVSDNIYENNVLVIDTVKIYLYYDPKRTLKEIFELDNIRSNEDIVNLREIIINVLS